MKKRLFPLTLIIMSLALLAGCAVMDTDTYNWVVSEQTPLNESGPNQTTPSDVTLQTGDRVRLVNDAGDYVYVETVRGERGFIPKSVVHSQKSGE
jgi:hypothetical protein